MGDELKWTQNTLSAHTKLKFALCLLDFFFQREPTTALLHPPSYVSIPILESQEQFDLVVIAYWLHISISVSFPNNTDNIIYSEAFTL
jgi:hypothetical protein